MYPHPPTHGPPNLNFTNAPPPPAAHQSAQPSYLNPQFAPPPKVPGQSSSSGLLKSLNIFSSRPVGPALGPASPGGFAPQQQVYHQAVQPQHQQQYQPQYQQQPIQQQQQQYAPPQPAAPPPYAPPEKPPPHHASPPQQHSPFVPAANYATRPASAGHADWSGLLDYAVSPPGPTLKLRGLLRAIADTLSRENTDASPAGILSPAKMAVYYAPLPAYATFFGAKRPRALAAFYRALGCEHVLVPTADDAVALPGLTAAGFETWNLHQLHLHPDAAAQLLAAYTSTHTLTDAATSRSFPSSPLPRSALPSHPDAAAAQRHAAVWNATIHAPPGTPDTDSDADRLRRQLVELQTAHGTHASETQRLQRELDTLRAQKDRELAVMRKGAQETSRDAQALKADLERARAELATATADAAALTADRDRAQAELAALRPQLAAKEAELTRVTLAQAAKDAELQRATHSLSAKDAELQRANHSLSAKSAELNRATHALAAKDAELSQLTSQHAGDAAELARLRAAVHTTSALQSDLARHRAESDRLTAQLASLRSTHAAALAAEARKLAARDADVIAKTAEVEAGRREVLRLAHQLRVTTALPMTPPASEGGGATGGSPVIGGRGGGGVGEGRAGGYGGAGGYEKPVYGRRTSNVSVSSSVSAASPSVGSPSPIGFAFERRGTAMSGVSSVGSDAGRGRGALGRGGAVLPYPENP
ncbi:hypothetical protein EDC01DRAFT_728608 [Geopyxis carbonaria]|nr:hypothetical protein EDC01DRAFT_728608 [Geopyxis carbonaria]